jgi:hypothetical protein
MIVQERLRLYLETIYQETKTIRSALQLLDDEIVTSPLFLRGVKYSCPEGIIFRVEINFMVVHGELYMMGNTRFKIVNEMRILSKI